MALVEEALKKDPSAIDTLLRAARFYCKVYDTDRAIQLLRKALEKLPNNAYVHYYMGCCYRSKVHHMLNRREMVFSGDRKKLEELIQLAVNHLRKAEEIKEMLEYSCSFLADLYIIAKKV